MSQMVAVHTAGMGYLPLWLILAMRAVFGLSASDPMSPSAYCVLLHTDVPQSGSVAGRVADTVAINVTRALAPIGADRFYALVRSGFYDEAAFFRVVPGFVLQFGIAGHPADNGPGSNWSRAIADDPVLTSNTRGTISFAKTSRPNSRTTQVFVNLADNVYLDGMGFAVLGRVVRGMDTLLHVMNPTAGSSTGVNQSQYKAQGNSWIRRKYPGINFVVNATAASGPCREHAADDNNGDGDGDDGGGGGDGGGGHSERAYFSFTAAETQGVVLALLAALTHVAYGRTRHIVGTGTHPARLAEALDVGRFVLCWYAISISFTLFNKWFLSVHGFHYPFGTSAIHMLVKLVLSRAVAGCITRTMEQECGGDDGSSGGGSGGGVTSISRRTYCRRAVPIGIATGCDVALSNLALLVVPVHFYTIVKSSSVLWVMFFSVMLGLLTPSAPLVAVVLLIAGGVGMASFGEVAFSWVGLLVVLGAAACGGLRWALTQLFLLTLGGGRARASTAPVRSPAGAGARGSIGGGNTDMGHARGFASVTEMQPEAAVARARRARLSALSLVYYISPASFLALVPAFFAFEFRDLVTSPFASHPSQLVSALLMTLCGGVLAFALILVEVELVSRTSSLSLAVAGNLKDCLQVTLSVLVFGETVSTLNVLGLCAAITGILLYTRSRMRQHRITTTRPAQQYRAVELQSATYADDDAGGDSDDDTVDVDVVDMTALARREAADGVGMSEDKVVSLIDTSIDPQDI